MEVLTEEVLGLKAVLDESSSSRENLLEALNRLRAKGCLPTKVLSDSMVGKTVNNLAKVHVIEEVKASARALVEEWRMAHKKRQSPGLGGDAAKLARTDSTTSLMSEALPVANAPLTAELKKTPRVASAQREKVQLKLLDALSKEEAVETKAFVEGGKTSDQDMMRDPLELSKDIEEALSYLEEKEYFNQARAILYNLKDKKNHTFRIKLLYGFYKQDQFAKLSAEDMASDEKNAERAKMRKYSMEEIQSDWALKNGQQRITGMFTCGKCKGVKTTYFQMQTRSSDEPMTTFVTCLACNNRWKFC